MMKALRGLKAALNSRGQYKYKAPEMVVDHLVVGGGVVGLAIARQLSMTFPEKTTYLVERNSSAGQEISSRNSEVIHAGLYYPPDSLKESLCIRGRYLLYHYCNKNGVPYRKTQKLVVALQQQKDYVESLALKAKKKRWPLVEATDSMKGEIYPPREQAVPVKLLSGDEARELEPDLSPQIVAALLSTETGIIDSHAFMSSLEGAISASENGELVYSTPVVRVDPYDNATEREDGWVVQMQTLLPTPGDTSSTDALLARTLINASGLSSHLILNSLLPIDQRIPMYYARGNYAAYKGSGTSRVSRLLYPSPFPNSASTGGHAHAFQSLGTHLTLDLEGNVRFGPDLQWISPGGIGGSISARITHSNVSSTSDRGDGHMHVTGCDLDVTAFSYDESDIDFWKHYLTPDELQIGAMHEAVRTYLPDVDTEKFRPDYVGIRPKLVPQGGGFQDFVFRRDYASTFRCDGKGLAGDRKKVGCGEMITLMGIESPGLTSSLAIAEKVAGMLSEPQI